MGLLVGTIILNVFILLKKPAEPVDNYERIKILLVEELSKIKLDSAVVQNIYYIKETEKKQKQQIANLDSVQTDSALISKWQNWKKTKEG